MNITKDNIKEKLNYLGINLEENEVPEFLKKYEPVNFNTSRLNNDKEHRIFKYVPINNIEILLTPNHRGDDIRKKYSEALPLSEYLIPKDDEENVELFGTFMNMINTVKIEEIENVAKVQKELEKQIPFKVSYDKCHLWQIYYSQSTDKYFMLVSTKENTFAEFFYLLKKQIEYYKIKPAKVPEIYVPINYIHYTEEYLTRSEIADIENYMWLFTKNWSLVYEVFDKNGKMSSQIVGDTYVYEKAKSTFKIKIENKEQAIKFYKLLKALFIMQTEIMGKYSFETKIDNQNNLEFWFQDQRITFDNLSDFIREQYIKTEKEIKNQNITVETLSNKLKSLKEVSTQKEKEYLEKQKEISTYLEYRKTFLGKFKYFFKAGKVKKIKSKQVEEQEDIEQDNKKIDAKPMQVYMDDKKFHTIEDLITIHSLLEKSIKYSKNLNQDIYALEQKIENLNKKIENATLYITEIDKHKKSIFDFWKFANKDELKALEMGNKEENSSNTSRNIKKIFDIETDLEELGINVDNLQRKKLSKEEEDSIFVAKTNMLYIINMIRNGNFDKDALRVALDTLKEEFENQKILISSEAFDIFGNINEDNTKIKYIGSKSHRENEKNKFKILNINKKIDVIDFTEKIQEIVNYLNESLLKINALYDMSIYKMLPINEHLRDKSFDVYNLSIENELEDAMAQEEGAYNLIKINLKEGMPLVYFSNIILYDNYNKTLPVRNGH